MNAADLDLVPVALGGPPPSLQQTLEGLGYRIRLVQAGTLDARSEHGPPPPAILLLGSLDWPRKRVQAALDCASTRPSLALVLGGESGWDPELLRHCSDCAPWPCSGPELEFRLSRLCAFQGGLPSHPIDPELIRLLAGLNLVGHSCAFLRAMDQVRRLVRCDAPVLIGGETGTGKELVARAIHYLGGRSGGPFVPVNCGALPDHLVENELFGHERGAYTDARQGALGAVGEAAGGTLFLDELEALSPKAQAALLRFLQDREYRPLGGKLSRRSDARVIAASNADLRQLCERRELRSDLYFRLDILSVVLPPLRDRVDDIEPLAKHFVSLYAGQYGLGPLALDRRCVPELLSYPWPGNIRELQNLVHRQVLLAEGLRVWVSPGAAQPAPDLVTPGAEGRGFAEAKTMAIDAFERDYLRRLMQESGGNVTQAARRAGKERRALGKLLKKHRLLPSEPN